MSQVFVTELPEMLFDAQRADACKCRYYRNEDVFTLDKWHSLVESACQSGDLAAAQGTVDIEIVNDWLGWPAVGLWSVFRLHNPLVPDMQGLYAKAYPEMDEGLKARIAKADPCLAHRWDSLTPAERCNRVIACDSLNAPQARLFDALGNLCFWNGDESGKSVRSALAAEIESWKTLVADKPSEKKLRDTKLAQLEQSMKRCDAVREQLLAGVIPDGEKTGAVIDLLWQLAGESWCREIRFPIWLESVEHEQADRAIVDTSDPGGVAMNRKVIFWLAPNEILIPADLIPGAIADTLYPPPERNELAGQAPNDPNAGKRHEEERVQSKQLRIKFPHLKDGDKFSIGDLNDYLARHEMVAEIRRRSDVIDNLDPKSRWGNRLCVDGFKSVQDSVPEAKHSRAEASDERCIELANLQELYVDHWIELVGVGLGRHFLYDISAECVKFRKHEDEYISLCPAAWQADMMRDNRVAPELKFPCTPVEVLYFIDALSDFCDTAIGMHSFILPDAFRGAVATSKRNAIEIPASDEQTVIRKRAALISEVVAFWPSIKQDLSDSGRNGLHACAKHVRHGYWFVEPALGWATQRGKIQKTMAQSFVIKNEDSRLTPMLRVLLKLN